MEKINIASAQYINGEDGNQCGILITIGEKEIIVPLDSDNRHYAEIMRQVDADELTILQAE